MPKNIEASRVAEAGSRHPIKVALTGPICFTPSRKAEKPPAVPTIIITAIISQAIKSRSFGIIQALVIIDMTRPPISIPHPVTSMFPHLEMIGREKSVYVITPTADRSPNISPAGEIVMFLGFPPVEIKYVPKTARKTARTCESIILVFVTMDIKTIIITTFRLCNTVAVAESEYFMALTKVYWHIKSPRMAKARSQDTSFGWVQILKILSFSFLSLTADIIKRTTPDKTILMAVNQAESSS